MRRNRTQFECKACGSEVKPVLWSESDSVYVCYDCGEMANIIEFYKNMQCPECDADESSLDEYEAWSHGSTKFVRCCECGFVVRKSKILQVNQEQEEAGEQA